MINLKKTKKKKGRQLEQVQFCVVSSCRFPSHRRRSIGDRNAINGRKENPSEDSERLNACPVLLFLSLLCGKCCSSLLTLPGAHPVCEIFTVRIVPLLRWNENYSLLFKCIVHFIYLIVIFLPLIILKWHAPLFGLILGIWIFYLKSNPEPTMLKLKWTKLPVAYNRVSCVFGVW